MEKLFKNIKKIKDTFSLDNNLVKFNYLNYDIEYNREDNLLSLNHENINIDINFSIKKLTIKTDSLMLIHEYNPQNNKLILLLDYNIIDFPEYLEYNNYLLENDENKYTITNLDLGTIYSFNNNTITLFSHFQIYSFYTNGFIYRKNERKTYRYEFSRYFSINLSFDNYMYEKAYNFDNWQTIYVKILSEKIDSTSKYYITAYKENNIVDVDMEKNNRIINLNRYYEIITKKYKFIYRDGQYIDRINKLNFDTFKDLLLEIDNNYLLYI
jgi:hypothetical protein